MSNAQAIAEFALKMGLASIVQWGHTRNGHLRLPGKQRTLCGAVITRPVTHHGNLDTQPVCQRCLEAAVRRWKGDVDAGS